MKDERITARASVTHLRKTEKETLLKHSHRSSGAPGDFNYPHICWVCCSSILNQNHSFIPHRTILLCNKSKKE